MAVYYSDHFDGGANTILDKGKRVSAGIGHGRLRYSRAEVTTLASPAFGAGGAGSTNPDTIRMMQFKSGDYLNEVYLTATDAGDTGDVWIGLWKSGRDHDGAYLDRNMLGSRDVNASAKIYLESLGNGNPDMDFFRGSALWEMAAVSGAAPTTYTSDPVEDWDLVISCAEIFTAATTLILEVYFTGGD